MLIELWVALAVAVVIGGPVTVIQNVQCRRHGHQPTYPGGRVCRRCRRWINPVTKEIT